MTFLALLPLFLDSGCEVRAITREEILMDPVFAFFDTYNKRRDLAFATAHRYAEYKGHVDFHVLFPTFGKRPRVPRHG